MTLRQAVARVLSCHVDGNTHRAWIIGSEAAGRAVPGADIDIALEGPEPIDLALLSRIRSDLDELATLRPFDLIDLRRAAAGFHDDALDAAIPLHLHEGGLARVQS